MRNYGHNDMEAIHAAVPVEVEKLPEPEYSGTEACGVPTETGGGNSLLGKAWEKAKEIAEALEAAKNA